MAAVFNYVRAELKNRFATSKIKRVQKTALSSKICSGEYRATVMPIIREIQKSGVETLWAIADTLNARGVRGARGGKWYAHDCADVP
jgi:hypothetical protein